MTRKKKHRNTGYPDDNQQLQRILAAREHNRRRCAAYIRAYGALPDRIALAHWYGCGPLEAQAQARAEGWQQTEPTDGHLHPTEPHGPHSWVHRWIAPPAHCDIALTY